MQRWEYWSEARDVVENSSEEDDEWLAQLGNDGWELAAVVPLRDSDECLYHFKRPAQDDGAEPAAEAGK